MAEITYGDWARMYALIEKERRKQAANQPSTNYLKVLEQDQVEAVTQMVAAINKIDGVVPIKYNPGVDIICDVIDPPLDIYPQLADPKIPFLPNRKELESYRDGNKPAELRPRLAC